MKNMLISIVLGVVLSLGVISESGIETVARTSAAGGSAQGAETKQFISRRNEINPALADLYVDFSFDYPASWTLSPTTPTEFVKISRMHPTGDALEEFGVAPFRHGAPTGNRIRNEMARNLNATYLQLKRLYRGIKKISEGETTVGAHKGYEMRFERRLEYYGGAEEATVWMRIVLVPCGARQRKGVTLIMTATSLSPEFKSADDVGVKGALPMILNSFKLGPGAR